MQYFIKQSKNAKQNIISKKSHIKKRLNYIKDKKMKIVNFHQMKLLDQVFHIQILWPLLRLQEVFLNNDRHQ